MLMTSMANTAAASGVPKIAENPALMPHIMAIFLSFSSSRKALPIRFPRLPPSCSAAPSRPTEAVARWLSRVEIKISGAVAGVTSSVEEIESRTISVPRFFSSCANRYSHTIRSPTSGSRYNVQLWLFQKAVAFWMPRPNSVPARPIVTPEIAEMKVHFKK